MIGRIRWYIMASMSLMDEFNRVIGRRELVSCGSFPGFESGTRNTFLISLGIYPVAYIRLASVVVDGIMAGNFLYTSVGSPSGPGALLGVRLFIALWTSAMVISLCGLLTFSVKVFNGSSSG